MTPQPGANIRDDETLRERIARVRAELFELAAQLETLGDKQPERLTAALTVQSVANRLGEVQRLMSSTSSR